MAQTQTLKIAHFNDAYKVDDQKVKVNGVKEVINVTKFSGVMKSVKKQWKEEGFTGVTVFSGDLFSPSTQSSTTKGRHMVPVIKALGVDVSVVGNHEFDSGLKQLEKLLPMTEIPWLLSNVIDKNTGKVPDKMDELFVLERDGLRIGFIGLIEREWIATVAGWPENFEFQEMKEVGLRLSAELRDPSGPHKCDLVIAVTHCRIPNDITLARDLYALTTTSPDYATIASKQGVDILLGGHDHNYWVSKGVSSWEGYDVTQIDEDAKEDRGDVLVVKSGTDFHDLTELTLTLEDAPAGSVRRKIITVTNGKRHSITTASEVDTDMVALVDNELSELQAQMKEPICITSVALNTKSKYIRSQESPIANWISDCLLPAYDDVLVKLGHRKADGVLLCTGSMRDGPEFEVNGVIKLGDLMSILPFDDPTVVVEMTGADLWTALESGLSLWPAQQGRFPAISGFRVEWKSQNEGLHRVQGIWLQEFTNELGSDKRPKKVDKERIPQDSQKKYLIVTGKYLADGNDGYTIMKSQKVVLNEENGKLKSALIQQYLTGAHYINIFMELHGAPGQDSNSFRASSSAANTRGASEDNGLPQASSGMEMASRDIQVLSQRISLLSDSQDEVEALMEKPTFTWDSSPDLIKMALSISLMADMSLVDPYERYKRSLEDSWGTTANSGSIGTRSIARDMGPAQVQENVKKNLPIISPIVDGRLKDLDGKAGQ